MTIFRGLLIFLSFFCFSANGQNAEILGKAEFWAGKNVYLTAEKDPISHSLFIVYTDTIAADGTFKLVADTSKIQQYWIRVNRFKAPIWLEPGKEYSISIIPVPENKLVDTWQNGGFEYAFLSLDSADINQQLADFDTQYYNFYLDNARFIGTSQLKSKVRGFVNNQEASISDDFIDIYKEYTLAEMKLSSGFKRDDLFNEYLKNKPLHIGNPAYYNFFDLFYADNFQSYDLKFGGATIANRLKKGMPADSVNTLMSIDYFLENDTIRQLVLLKSISEVYSNPAYPTENLKQVLDLIIHDPASKQIGEIANRLKAKLDNSLIGSKFSNYTSSLHPAFILSNDTLPTVYLISYEGSVESEKEAMILKSLLEKYSDFAHFAEVRISNSNQKPGRDWPVYYPDNKLEFLNQFEIYRFPHFIWVNGNGEIAENGIEKPSEGLEKRLFKIKSDYEEKNRIKVGK